MEARDGFPPEKFKFWDYTGIVDEDIEELVFFGNMGCRCSDGCVVCYVERDGVDPGACGIKCRGGWVARAEADMCVWIDELLYDLVANSLVSACYEDCCTR